MSNVVNTLLGNSNVPSFNLNTPYKTQYSTLQNGKLTLDPTIRDIQNQALTGYTNLLPNLQQDYSNLFNTSGLRNVSSGLTDLASQLTGNRNAFIQARVDPLRQALAQRTGQLQQSLNRRGVFGTFGNQDMNNLAISGNQAIGDAQAQATQEALNSLLGVNQAQAGVQGQILGANAGLVSARQNQNNQYLNTLNAINSLGSQRFMQELQGLGISADTLANLMKLQQTAGYYQDKAGQNAFTDWTKLGSAIGAGMQAPDGLSLGTGLSVL